MASSFSMRILLFVATTVLLMGSSVTTAVAADTKTISSVEVQEEDGVTRIILRGAEDPIYTAFMRENPPRLIVELPDVVFSGVNTPIRVENGLVEHVTLGAFGDPRVALSMARISVELAAESEYELLPDGDELVIAIRPLDSGGTGPAPATASVEDQATPSLPAAPAGASSWDDAAWRDETDSAQEGAPVTADATAEQGSEAAPVETETTPAGSDATAPTESSPTPAGADEAAKPAAGTPSEPALSRLLEVLPAEDGIEVRADGPIDNVDSFTLDEPSRLVVDFWGVQNSVWPARQAIDTAWVRAVRIGEHPDKVRVVLDLVAPIASHGIEPTENGVMIRIESAGKTAGDATASSEPMPAAPLDEEVAESEPAPMETAESETVPSPLAAEATPSGAEAPAAGDIDPVFVSDAEAEAAAAEEMTQPSETEDLAADELTPADWDGPVEVQSVHFESLPETDRVVATLTRAIETKVVEPDEATVIVMLPGAQIPTDAERRVDTKEFGGPVELFSVFETPDVSYDEVRIVLKRRAGVKPRLSWDGNQLLIEMTHGAPTWDEAAEMSDEMQTAAETQAGAGTDSMAAPGDESSTQGAQTAEAPAPAGPGEASAAGVTSALVPAADDPFLMEGPADPASIDILEEGGFTDEKEYTGRRISLDFKDADIANILRLIAEVSDLNVIAGEEVTGVVTIRLVDVPWDQALDVILLTKGLGFVRVGNVLRIAPLETLKLEAEARLQDRRAKEKLEDLVVKLQPVNYAEVKEIKDLVKKLLSKRGTVNTDNRTNTLIIKDIPSVVQEATALVKAIDTQTPQVLIESKIVEATLSFSRSLGAVWGAGYRPVGTSTWRGGAEDLHLGDGSLTDLIGLPSGTQATNFIASNPIFDANNGFLSLGLLGFDDHLQLDLAIEAAETNNKGKVISSPRVVTLDNRQAVIKQGVAIKFEAATRDKITISFIDAVLELKVTPHITANRSIIMQVKISRNAPSISAATGDIVGIDKNEATTEALVRDGETMVLGGIYVVDSGKNQTKTPFLADIPLFGNAFQSKVLQDERRELLIFVTPRIIMGTPGSAEL